VTATVLDNLGICYQDQQMYSESEHMFQILLSLLRSRPEDNKSEISTVLNNLAVTYDLSGQAQNAIETYEEALEMATGDPQTPALRLATCMCVIKFCCLCQVLLRICSHMNCLYD
jgi:tetratricopeptide (TPR) repeat protein